MVADGVNIDEDEWSVIKQPPKKAIFERLELMRMKMDSNECHCKVRWGREKRKTEEGYDRGRKEGRG